MEVKKVMPVVKPVGASTPVAPKPVTPVAPVQPVQAVKPVAPVAPAPVSVPVSTPAPAAPVQEPVKEEVKEAPKGGLFSQPSVADKSKEERLTDVKNAVKGVKEKKADKPAVNSEDTDGEEVDEENDESDDDSKKKGKGKEKKWEGPRVVRVYGQELFVEENPKVTLEEIRKRIVDQFHYPEFTKERTVMSMDENTGIIVPVIKFEKRG